MPTFSPRVFLSVSSTPSPRRATFATVEEESSEDDVDIPMSFNHQPSEDYSRDTDSEPDCPPLVAVDDEPHPSYQLTEELFKGTASVSGALIKALPPYFHILAQPLAETDATSAQDQIAPKKFSQDDFFLHPSPSSSKFGRPLSIPTVKASFLNGMSKHTTHISIDTTATMGSHPEKVDYLQYPFYQTPDVFMPTWSAVVAERVPRHVLNLIREAVFDFADGELISALQFDAYQKRLEGVIWRAWAMSSVVPEPHGGHKTPWNEKAKAAWRHKFEGYDCAFDHSFQTRRSRCLPSFEPWLYGPIISSCDPLSSAIMASPVSTVLDTPSSTLRSCLKLPIFKESTEVELLGTMLGDAYGDQLAASWFEEEESDTDNEREYDGSNGPTSADSAADSDAESRPPLSRSASLPPLLLRRSSVLSISSSIISRLPEFPLDMSFANDKLFGRVAAVAHERVRARRAKILRSRSASPPEVGSELKDRRIEFNTVVDRRVILDLDGSTTEGDGGSSGDEEQSEGESDNQSRKLVMDLRAARLRAGKHVHEPRRSASTPVSRLKKSSTRSLTAPIEPVTLAPAHEVPERSATPFFDPSWMPEEVAASDVLLYSAEYHDAEADAKDDGFEWGKQRIAVRRGGGMKRRATWLPSKTTGSQRRSGRTKDSIDSASQVTVSSLSAKKAGGLVRSKSSTGSLSELSNETLGLGLRISSANLQQLKYQKEATGEARGSICGGGSNAPRNSTSRLTLIRQGSITLRGKPEKKKPLEVTVASLKKASLGVIEERWIETSGAESDEDQVGVGYWMSTPTPSSSPAPRVNSFKRKVDCSFIKADQLPHLPPTLSRPSRSPVENSQVIAPKPQRWASDSTSMATLRSILGGEGSDRISAQSMMAPGPHHI